MRYIIIVYITRIIRDHGIYRLGYNIRYTFYRRDLRVGQMRTDQVDGRYGDRTGRYLHAVAPHSGIAVGHHLHVTTAVEPRRDIVCARTAAVYIQSPTTIYELATGRISVCSPRVKNSRIYNILRQTERRGVQQSLAAFDDGDDDDDDVRATGSDRVFVVIIAAVARHLIVEIARIR